MARSAPPSRAPTRVAVEAPTTVVEAPAPARRQAVRPPPIPAPRHSLMRANIPTPVPAPRRQAIAPAAAVVVSSDDDEVMIVSDDEDVTPQPQTRQAELPRNYQAVVPRFHEPAVPHGAVSVLLPLSNQCLATTKRLFHAFTNQRFLKADVDVLPLSSSSNCPIVFKPPPLVCL